MSGFSQQIITVVLKVSYTGKRTLLQAYFIYKIIFNDNSIYGRVRDFPQLLHPGQIWEPPSLLPSWHKAIKLARVCS
jgi:hypothetical protein